MQLSADELKQFTGLFERLSFDRDQYLAQNKDLSASDLPWLIEHLFRHGLSEGRADKVKFGLPHALQEELARLPTLLEVTSANES